MNKKLLEYYNGDEFAASVWYGKYALKNEKGEIVEETPADMHLRMAREFARKEYENLQSDKKVLKEKFNLLSDYGHSLYNDLQNLEEQDIVLFVLSYLSKYKYIVPQGSIMSALGNIYKVQSLSNCFVIPPPLDSYGGIFKTDQQIAQIEKRRGGVGTTINTLRPDDTPVLNAAGTSTGAHSFMDRYSNTTREVAQNGRRGALMLLMSVQHPDIFKFVNKKRDRTKVTGANISVQLTNKFMRAVKTDSDFICTFPINTGIVHGSTEGIEYNKLYTNPQNSKIHYMKIKAKELYDLIVENAWENAEPGVAFMDRIVNYSPEGVYKRYLPIACNPCGEQWLNPHDACRLLAVNLFNLVKNAFKKDAYIDYELAYEIFYMQQRLGDLVVDLEIEYVDRIIAKIISDPEPEDVKATELQLWKNVRETAAASRRTGCGHTALGDMLAALGLKYDSKEAIETTKKLMHTKMRAELDCSIDLAVFRGPFEGWDNSLEFPNERSSTEDIGGNEFYTMLLSDFPEQAIRMMRNGRRNVSWSTVAPTGSLSIISILKNYANTSGGCEPQFGCYFFRNKKVNPSDKNVRVDFVDQNGDSWQTYPVVMGGFKEWYDAQVEQNADFLIQNDYGDTIPLENLDKEQMLFLYKNSPYYQACAEDIDWEKRIEMQGAIQKYTTNAISSTLNLPKDVSKETISGIYMAAWEKGLKGVTVYRDGCRSGVLVKETKKENEFHQHDAPKRPSLLKCQIHTTVSKGTKFNVFVGFIDNHPYEVFATPYFTSLEEGIIAKRNKGKYDLLNEKNEVIQENFLSDLGDEEGTITRLLSTSLRHGANIQFIVEQLNKVHGNITGFTKAIARVLKKYVSDEKLLKRAECSDCGSVNLKVQEGCVVCNDCGSSKCG